MSKIIHAARRFAPSSDPIVLALTRDNYLLLAYPEGVPNPLPAELAASCPGVQRAYDRSALQT